jgi:hypothetical protein
MAHVNQHGGWATAAKRRGEELALCATCGERPRVRTCPAGHPHIPENRGSNGPGRTRCIQCDRDRNAIARRTECRTPLGRFMDSFRRLPNGCWQWTGALADTRYGTIGIGGRSVLAHRHSFALFKGPIPAGLDVDHLCRNRSCVNPDHLEAVTHLENIRRSLPAKCKRGHDWSDPRNWYIRPGNGYRMCRPCQQLRNRGAAA